MFEERFRVIARPRITHPTEAYGRSNLLKIAGRLEIASAVGSTVEV
jgi:hypothetical protein